jgi:chromatin segregation and condensation protein Rec8/ScpA/Scc1 (kleisin family)
MGIVLAVLELVRHQRILAEQNQLFGEVWLLANPAHTGPLDLAGVDTYEHARKAPA